MKGFGAGGMQALMRQANQMQNKMKKMREEFATREFQASSGGGAVQVTVTGDSVLKMVQIQEDVFKAGDKDMLQDLVVTAVNEAMRTAKTTMDEEMTKITGGFSMPGMF